MATSFVNFKGKGFWANDGIVEFMQLCLINEIESSKIEEEEEWIKNYKLEIAIQSIPIILGGVTMKFDEFLLTEQRTDLILELVENIIFKIENEIDYVTGNNINKFRIRAMEILRENKELPDDNKTFEKYVNRSGWQNSKIENFRELYIRHLFLLKGLLLGKLRTTSDSPISYWKKNS